MRRATHRSKLARLTPEEQSEIAKHCARLSIPKGVEWLAEERGISISQTALGEWLRGRRGGPALVGPMRKTRPDNILGNLPEEKQELIFEYCEKFKLGDGLEWLKAEHGVKISQNALSRWLRKRRENLDMEDRLEDIRDDRDRAGLVGGMIGAAAAFSKANCVMVSQAVFEEFRKKPEERDEERLITLMGLALKASSGGLAREKFEFDAVTLARKHAAELVEINEGGESEEEKMKRAMVLLFGERPEVDVTTMTDEECDAVLAGEEEAE